MLSGAAGDYQPVTDRDREVFRREWERGTPLKTIAGMLERSEPALRNWRHMMGLARRQRPVGGRDEGEVARVTFELPRAWRDALGLRVRQRRLTLSRYLRELIEADLDPGE